MIKKSKIFTKAYCFYHFLFPFVHKTELKTSALVFLIFILWGLVSCTPNKNTAALPVVKILFEDKIRWDKKSTCSIVYQTEDGVDTLSAKAKYRGGISSRYDKHSYRLELEVPYPLGDLPIEDDWILNASYIDKTFIRHKLNYDLFRSMNPENVAAKSTFIELYKNEDYKGLYLLQQKITAKLVGLDKQDSSAVLFKDPPIFYQEAFMVADSLNPYEQKFPKINKRNLTHRMEELSDFLNNSADSTFLTNVWNYFDKTNIVDWHLLLLFSNNEDGLVKNFYLYQRLANEPYRIAIWDYDHTFGRDGDNEMNFFERFIDVRRANLFDRLIALDTTYMTAVANRWQDLRTSGVISFEKIDGMIEGYNNQIINYVPKNQVIWPIDEKWYFDSNDYQKELELLRSFIEIQIVRLDELFGWKHYK